MDRLIGSKNLPSEKGIAIKEMRIEVIREVDVCLPKVAMITKTRDMSKEGSLLRIFLESMGFFCTTSITRSMNGRVTAVTLARQARKNVNKLKRFRSRV